MKVSNGNSIQKIYQEQLQKTKNEGSGDSFKKIMKDATPQEASAGSVKKSPFHPPSGMSLTNQVFSGKPVKQADPVTTMKFAAEVVATQPDIREERISLIKSLIAKGQYNIPSDVVADKLMHNQDGFKFLMEPWEA